MKWLAEFLTDGGVPVVLSFGLFLVALVWGGSLLTDAVVRVIHRKRRT